jgi:hypothetical protein
MSMQMESRVCACGCGNSFRVMAKSPQVFASEIHERERHPERFQRGARIPAKKPPPRLDLVHKVEQKAVIEFKDVSGPIDADAMEARWKKYIADAKKHVSNISNSRMETARIAVEACDIHYGGGDHWKKFDGVYTLKRFAHEIGINEKTLYGWVGIYQNVFAKLGALENGKGGFEAARRVMNKVNRHTSADEVKRLYKVELNTSQDREHLLRGIKRFKTLHYYITKKANLPILEAECLAELEELYVLAQGVVEALQGPRLNAIVKASERNRT